MTLPTSTEAATSERSEALGSQGEVPPAKTLENQISPTSDFPTVIQNRKRRSHAKNPAHQVLETTVRSYHNIPSILPTTISLPIGEVPICSIWPSLILFGILILFYSKRPPYSSIRPSSFIIPSTSIFKSPRHYAREKKVSVPRLAADYVGGEVLFRQPMKSHIAMSRLEEWAYFPGSAFLAKIGLVPLLYICGDNWKSVLVEDTKTSKSPRDVLEDDESLEIDRKCTAWMYQQARSRSNPHFESLKSVVYRRACIQATSFEASAI